MEVSTKRRRIAELAKRSPKMCFTALNHHLDMELLQEAYRRLRKDSSPGVDGQTVREYGEGLEANLQLLLDRAKSGSYYAQPVKRVHIPKDTSGKETRPIGIPATEDKLLQRAVSMILEPIYEQDFLDCSYGFRPGRSAHDALDAFWRQCTNMGVRYIIDLDISKFFDTLDRAHLRTFLRNRVRDGVITRLIDKWLNAGVMEQGALQYPERGTPQGGSISPLLSNIYLHYVLDQWFEEQVKPRMRGMAFIVRFADDAVLGFSSKQDSEKVLEVLPKRFSRFGLTLHPEKTRLVAFGRPGKDARKGSDTLEFLGFTHYWGKSRKGNWVIKRKTSRKRLNRTLKRIAEWCRRNRHKPIKEQHQKLCRWLQGHFAYFGVTGNGWWLQKVRERVKKIWRKWLQRRGGRSPMPWEKFRLLLQRYPLPPARVVHSIYAAKP
jgi:group II intron reverse transcriptase/maturase